MSEEPLTVPPNAAQTGAEAAPWTVVAKNERVNRDWQELIKTAAANTAKCYDYLRSTPMLRRPGRIFPLRGKKYAGAWEYELTAGDRVFYVPDPKVKEVTVYYAGPHPVQHHSRQGSEIWSWPLQWHAQARQGNNIVDKTAKTAYY